MLKIILHSHDYDHFHTLIKDKQVWLATGQRHGTDECYWPATPSARPLRDFPGHADTCGASTECRDTDRERAALNECIPDHTGTTTL